VVRFRKVLFWIVVVFLLYAVFSSPDQAAGIVRTAIGGILAALGAIGDFFDALLAG
jgi:hypothetical protein